MNILCNQTANGVLEDNLLLESGVQENSEFWREGWGVAAGHRAPVLGRAGDFGGLSSRHALGQAQHCPAVNPQASTVAPVRSQRCL